MSGEDSAFASFERKWLEANPEQAAVLVFLRPAQRQSARAFGSLIHELTQTAFVVREAQVAAAKLSWWQQELIGAAAGNPRHPISRELFRNVSAIDPAIWRALIDGAIAQLDASFPSSFKDLITSLSDFFGPVAAIETQLAGGSESQVDAVAKLWICSHLLLVAQNASHFAERTSMPLDLLARHGISRADLAASTPAQIAVLKDFIGQVRGTIIENRRQISSASLGRLVRARADRWLADRAVRADNPADYLARHARNLRWRSLWWAWQEARHLTSHSADPKSERAA
jgi:15-cis-phytoene synthase